MGSGTKIKAAIKKYGIKNFKKEILFEFNNSEDAAKKEAEIVNEKFIERKDTYNIVLGGGKYISDFATVKDGNIFGVKKDDPRYLSGELKFHWTGKTHKDETKKKIGEKNSFHQKGNKNSQYGSCWIYNEKLKESKKIKKEFLVCWLNKGWKKGRKLKF
jgi:hypothetical protein